MARLVRRMSVRSLRLGNFVMNPNTKELNEVIGLVCNGSCFLTLRSRQGVVMTLEIPSTTSMNCYTAE